MGRWPNSEDELGLGQLMGRRAAKSSGAGLRKTQAAESQARARRCRLEEARAGLAQPAVSTRHSSRFELWSVQAWHQCRRLHISLWQGTQGVLESASCMSEGGFSRLLRCTCFHFSLTVSV